MLDTYNFKPEYKDSKWTKEDEDARDFYAQFATLDKAYFDRLQNFKFGVDVALDIGLYGNIKRDYKQYVLDGPNGSKGKYGCAVMVFSPKQMFDRYGKKAVCDCIEAFMTEYNLHMFGIVHNEMHLDTEAIDRYVFNYSR